MALRADDLIDRRRLRRKLTFWRGAAIAIVALGVIALASWFYGEDLGGSSVDHIAKVRIEGTITEDEELIKRLGKAMAWYEIVITDETGERVCTARLTCVIRRAVPAAGG